MIRLIKKKKLFINFIKIYINLQLKGWENTFKIKCHVKRFKILQGFYKKEDIEIGESSLNKLIEKYEETGSVLDRKSDSRGASHSKVRLLKFILLR